jgi:hypothetical protein
MLVERGAKVKRWQYELGGSPDAHGKKLVVLHLSLSLSQTPINAIYFSCTLNKTIRYNKV